MNQSMGKKLNNGLMGHRMYREEYGIALTDDEYEIWGCIDSTESRMDGAKCWTHKRTNCVGTMEVTGHDYGVDEDDEGNQIFITYVDAKCNVCQSVQYGRS